MVALLDTYNMPGAWFDEPWALRVANAWKKIKSLPWSDKLTYGLQKAQDLAKQKTMANDEALQIHHAYENIALQTTVCEEALKEYRPQSYSGDIILLKAEETPESIGYRAAPIDNHLGWRQMVGGSIRVLPLQCHHFDVMEEPYIQQVIEHLQRCLEFA